MIVTEFLKERKDGVKLYKTYSNAGFLIEQVQTGKKYVEAIDVENSGFTYIETNEPIPEPPEVEVQDE